MKSLPQNKVKYICQYILSEIKHKLPGHFTYHNYEHTCDVINVCEKYARVFQLDKEETELLLIAATAHDYGFVISPFNHESIGADLASMLMAAYQYKDRQIRQVRSMIMATQVGATPVALLEKILADADLDYLGRDDYPEISERLHDELSYQGRLSSRTEWLKKQIAFLENHRYHTAYARLHRRTAKLDRLDSLKTDLIKYGQTLEIRQAVGF